MIVVIGSLNLDRTLVMERWPGPGETVSGLSFTESAGGKGGNVAAQAARLGGRTQFLGVTGRDSAAEIVRESQRSAHVDLTWLTSLADAPTGTASIWVERPSGENRIVVVPGANARLDPALVRDASSRGLFEGASCLVMNLEIPLSSVREGLAQAHARGVPVLLNRSPSAGIDSEELNSADVLVVNLPEAVELLDPRADSRPASFARGSPSPEVAYQVQAQAAASALAARTPAQVVVTAGAAGVATSGPRGEYALPSLRVRAQDTTGAGDAFLGALAFALDQGYDFLTELRVASLAGAHAVTKAGTLAAQADWAALSRFAAEHGVDLPPADVSVGWTAPDGPPAP